MAKNSRGRAAKKTNAKNAAKANQRKLQKRAQTESMTATLDKGLGLVYSVGAFLQNRKSTVSIFHPKVERTEQAQHAPNNPPQVGGDIEELLRRL